MIEFLLLIEIAVFFLGFVYIFNREKIFGLYYLFLFLYAIFAQIGYIYIPELSMLTQAYFGPGVWFDATRFIILSLFSIWIFFSLFWSRVVRLIPVSFYLKASHKGFSQPFAVFFLLVVFIFQLYYFAFNYESINWYSNSDEEVLKDNLLYRVFLFLFKFSLIINMVLYAIIKDGLGSYRRPLYYALFAVNFVLFVVIAFRLGNRTDLVAFALGILVYHLYRKNLNLKNYSAIAALIVFFWFFLDLVEKFRYESEVDGREGFGNFLFKDWYAPAHMLFAAINFHIIIPLEVLTSNAANSLFLIGYPYLQMGITDQFNPGVATRSQGYAFYILSEGYLFMGPFGFLYNSILVILGWATWKKFASSNNLMFNNFLIGLMGCMLINLVRSQGSFFIKYFYTFLIPGVILYAALAGLSLSIRYRNRFYKVK